MATKITVEVSGLAALRKFLTPPENFYGPVWSDGMNDIAKKSRLSAIAGAPMRSGKLKASIRERIQKKPFPTWIAVDAQARGRRGGNRSNYPYPRLLEYSSKHGHAGWLSNALNKVWRNVETDLNRIADAIARKWEN